MATIEAQCSVTGESFFIPDQAQRILRHFGLPLPRLGPTERLRRRMAFRNERVLHHRKCDLTGEPIVSVFDEHSPFPVYSQEAWWSDKWNPPEAEFDFSRPFFEQLRELQLKCPRMELLSKNADNARYANHSSSNRNGYMLFSAVNTEDCLYDLMIFNASDCVDSAYVYNKCELCYECFFADRLYKCIYCVQCSNSENLSFCFDCVSSKNCFLSSNLRHKEYVFMNQQLSKEEYEAKMAHFKQLTHSNRMEVLKHFEKMLKEQAIHQGNILKQCENSQGNFLMRCKDAWNTYFLEDGEDVCDMFQGQGVKSMYSVNNNAHCELVCHSMGAVGTSHSACVNLSYEDSNCMYVDHVFNSEDCFGCVGIKRGRYRILNKQYSFEEYESLKARIIEHMKSTGEWGQFFPPQMAPTPYNHTIAHQMFPLTEEEARRQGYDWAVEEALHVPEGALTAADLPERIIDVDDSILQKVIVCDISGKPFRIVPAELKFYRKMGLPLPRRHPEVRHSEILRFRPAPDQHQRTCSKCEVAMYSSISADRPDIVYCEKCYLAEVY